MANKKKTPRILLALLCGKCGAQNYLTTRNKTNTVEKLKLTKFCKWCRAKSEHKESAKLK